jgi:hemolysin-activating ACP:hemolysin acyltransferase
MTIESTRPNNVANDRLAELKNRSGENPLSALKRAATLGHITVILMRTPQHRHAFLSDLEWLVMPAIANNQLMMTDHRDGKTGVTVPLAVVLWACVSEEVDTRLSSHPEQRVRLKPEEWASGTIPWLVEAAGEPHAIGLLMRELIDRRFPDKDIKTIGRSADGKPCVRLLRKEAPGSAAKQAEAAERARAS